jgi:poly(3-hydroxybutyrate) depolymerase
VTVRRPLLGLLLALAVVVPARAGLAPEAATAGPASGGTVGRTETVTLPLEHAGDARSYSLHVPAGLRGEVPVVVALHGANQTSQRMRDYSELERLADEEGFVVAFGEAVAGTWDADGCCRASANDLAYLDAVLADLRDPARLGAEVDDDRVFLTGFSNGGMMALRYACERPGVVAAVATVSAAHVSSCTPTSPVSVLDVHGEIDGVVRLRGGRNTTFAADFPAVRTSLQPFRDAGGQVRVRVVPGVGHGWMASDTMYYDATGAVWAWLRDHPRQQRRPASSMD